MSSAVSGSHKARVRRRVALKRSGQIGGRTSFGGSGQSSPSRRFSVDKQSNPKPATFVHFRQPRRFGSISPMPSAFQWSNIRCSNAGERWFHFVALFLLQRREYVLSVSAPLAAGARGSRSVRCPGSRRYLPDPGACDASDARSKLDPDSCRDYLAADSRRAEPDCCGFRYDGFRLRRRKWAML
jgi:hypothetical protein